MSLTILDAKVVVIYAILTVILGFMLPALGMAGTAQTADDVPEFNVSQTRFDFVDDLPEFPQGVTSGYLNHSSDKFDDYRGSIQNELGPGDNGNRIFIVAINNTTVHLTDVEDSTINDSQTFTADDQTKTLDAYGYEIDVHSVDISENAGEYEYEITQEPPDASIFGTIFSSASSVFAVLAWIGTVIFTVVLLIIEGAANLGGLMFDTVTLFVDYGTWIVGFATTIIGSAPGYAAAIIAVVYSPMYFVFAKMMITLINMVNPFG